MGGPQNVTFFGLTPEELLENPPEFRTIGKPMSSEIDTPQPAAPPENEHRKKKVFEALQNERE